MSTTAARSSAGPVRRWWDRILAEAAKFGVVGAFGVVVDLGAYAFFQYGWFGPEHGPLHGHEKLASAAATAVATVYSWVFNRLWTFRGKRTDEPLREIVLFAFFNVVGALITVACVAVAIDVFGARGLTWESAARVVGIVVGTLFRFWAYRRYVFVSRPSPAAEAPDATDAPEASRAANAPRANA